MIKVQQQTDFGLELYARNSAVICLLTSLIFAAHTHACASFMIIIRPTLVVVNIPSQW